MVQTASDFCIPPCTSMVSVQLVRLHLHLVIATSFMINIDSITTLTRLCRVGHSTGELTQMKRLLVKKLSEFTELFAL
jgi:hypothetical protein